MPAPLLRVLFSLDCLGLPKAVGSPGCPAHKPGELRMSRVSRLFFRESRSLPVASREGTRKPPAFRKPQMPPRMQPASGRFSACTLNTPIAGVCRPTGEAADLLATRSRQGARQAGRPPGGPESYPPRARDPASGPPPSEPHAPRPYLLRTPASPLTGRTPDHRRRLRSRPAPPSR